MRLDTIVILEDEAPNSDRLQRLLIELKPSVRILAVLESVKTATEWFVKNESPDLVLMDVRLADGLSFEIFSYIEIKCPIVFTTAYDEYAVKAFKYNSLDYLLKPVEKDELEHALHKFEILQNNSTKLQVDIENLVASIQPNNYRTRFLLPYRDGYRSVQAGDIAYFSSESNASYAHFLSGDSIIIPQTLEKLERELDPKVFFRANRQFIIHIDSIKEVHNHFNSKLKIELKLESHAEIIISREKAPSFKTWMDF